MLQTPSNLITGFESNLEKSAAALGIPLLALAKTLPNYGHSPICPLLGSGRFVVADCTAHEGHHLIMMEEAKRFHVAAAAATSAVGSRHQQLLLPPPPPATLSTATLLKDHANRAEGDDDTMNGPAVVAAGGGLPMPQPPRPCRSMDEMLNGSFLGPEVAKGPDWPLSRIWEPHSGCHAPSLRPMNAVPLLHGRGIQRCACISG